MAEGSYLLSEEIVFNSSIEGDFFKDGHSTMGPSEPDETVAIVLEVAEDADRLMWPFCSNFVLTATSPEGLIMRTAGIDSRDEATGD